MNFMTDGDYNAGPVFVREARAVGNDRAVARMRGEQLAEMRFDPWAIFRVTAALASSTPGPASPIGRRAPFRAGSGNPARLSPF
jgi:hypothetical protein